MNSTKTTGAGQRADSWKRPVAALALLAAGVALLPLSALLVEAIVDDAGLAIAVLHLALTTGVGALVGAATTGLDPDADVRRRASVWAAVGLGAAIVGQLVWYLLLGS